MKRYLAAAITALLLAASAHASIALNPDVTPDTIQQTICLKGYTKTVRPPESYTNRIKRQLMREAGIDLSQTRAYELDHIVALTLGGSPRSLDNLQLLTTHDNLEKSRIEVKLQCMICGGTIPLAQAQQEMFDDWNATYQAYAGRRCQRHH